MQKPKLHHLGSKTLTTPALILRRVVADDAYGIFININHDPEVLRYFGAPYQEHFADCSIDGLVALSAKPDAYCWAIELRENHECIGILLQQERNDMIGSIEIGYALGSRYWRKGYATQAVQAVIEYLFSEVNYHKITAGYVLVNIASRRVLEKCQMQYEGIRRDDFYHHDQYFDIGYYYIINPRH